ncbi:MAG: adenylate/guanylate cyclase domain-containing protein [Bacteroidota bacterium]
MLKDTSGDLNLEEVVGSREFVSASETDFDKNTEVYWVKLVSQARLSQPEDWFMTFSFADSIIQYRNVTGNIEQVLSGDNVGFYDKEVQYGEYNFVKIPVQNGIQEHYMRLRSTSLFSKEFRSVGRFEFYSPERFDYIASYTRYFHGTFLGISFAMLIFIFIFYRIYKERAYLAYCVFLLIMTSYHLSITGFLHEFVFFNIPTIGKYSPLYTAWAGFYAFIYFTQIYLDSKAHAPKLHRILNFFIYLNTLVFFLSFFAINIANTLLFVTGVAIGILGLTIAFIANKKKYRPAKFFIIAYVGTIVSFTIFTLMKLGVLPEVFFTRYAYQMSFSLQALLFAMGLADRSILVRRELASKKLEQEKLVVKQEKELNDLLARKNVELELKVQERTQELVEKNKRVEADREIIRKERQKSEQLLLNILPEKIAKRLKSGEEKIAERFDNVTVFFSDIVGFTEMSKNIAPEELVDVLNNIFTRFDKLLVKHGLEKIKTIGDAYMCVSGLPEPKVDHAARVARFALDVIKELDLIKKDKGQSGLSVRIGIHTGTVVAGVIGEQKFAYDLWGEVVNMASRLESQGKEMQIQCSEKVHALLQHQFQFEERGIVQLKGVGLVKTFYLIKETNKVPNISAFV